MIGVKWSKPALAELDRLDGPGRGNRVLADALIDRLGVGWEGVDVDRLLEELAAEQDVVP